MLPGYWDVEGAGGGEAAILWFFQVLSQMPGSPPVRHLFIRLGLALLQHPFLWKQEWWGALHCDIAGRLKCGTKFGRESKEWFAGSISGIFWDICPCLNPRKHFVDTVGNPGRESASFT